MGVGALLLGGAGCAEPAPADFTARYVGPPAPFLAPPIPQSDPIEVGRDLLAAGEAELALVLFQEALAADPRSYEAMLGLGVASQRLGRMAQAERFFEQAVAVAPENAMAWNNLGVTRYERGNFFGAREALRTAFALDGGRSRQIQTNLTITEFVVPDRVDLDAVQAEFQLVRTGDGTYQLLDQTKPAEDD
ncbi:MAG: tetratricopeptide repeat protein [Pseudomonadota bacterium]